MRKTAIEIALPAIVTDRINKMNPLVDTHAHLHFKNFNKDREEVISRARDVVSAIIEVGVNFSSNAKVMELSRKHPGFIYPALGLHPAELQDNFEDVRHQILYHKGDIVAIGEVGLDFYHEREAEQRNRQKELLEEILSLAEETRLPVIIHSRDAEEECLEILSAYNPVKTIMHCFSGTLTQLNTSLERGYLISVPATVCFSKQKQKLAKAIPLDSLLLETDCPFLSPIKGKRNEPVYLTYSLKALSQILNKPEEEISHGTTENAKKLLKW